MVFVGDGVREEALMTTQAPPTHTNAACPTLSMDLPHTSQAVIHCEIIRQAAR